VAARHIGGAKGIRRFQRRSFPVFNPRVAGAFGPISFFPHTPNTSWLIFSISLEWLRNAAAKVGYVQRDRKIDPGDPVLDLGFVVSGYNAPSPL